MRNWNYQKGDIITTKEFYHGEDHHGCEQLAMFSSAYKQVPFMMACMKNSFCELVAPSYAYRKPYDLLSATAFPQRIVRRGKTTMKALKLAIEVHGVKRIVLFQGPDFHKKNSSSRFKTQWEEDIFHKQSLMDAARTINELYPQVEVVLIYLRIINGGKEAQFVEVSMNGVETVRLVTPYINFESCRIAIILCMDYRFAKQAIDCVREFVGSPFEVISFAGSIGSFLENSDHAKKAISVAYHKRGCRQFVAMPHEDCGYFGGSSAFADPEKERLFHESQVDKFRNAVTGIYEGAEVIGIYNELTRDKSKIQYVAC